MYIHKWKAISMFAGLNHKFIIQEEFFVINITK